VPRRIRLHGLGPSKTRSRCVPIREAPEVPARPRPPQRVSKVDMSCELSAAAGRTTIVIAPAGATSSSPEGGSSPFARAAKDGKTICSLSTLRPPRRSRRHRAPRRADLVQLYASAQRGRSPRALIKRADAAGCPVAVVDLDEWRHATRKRCSAAPRRTPGIARTATARIRGARAAQAQIRRQSTCRAGQAWSRRNMTGISPRGARHHAHVERSSSRASCARGPTLCSGKTAHRRSDRPPNHGARGRGQRPPTIDALTRDHQKPCAAPSGAVDSGCPARHDIVKGLALRQRARCASARPYLWAPGSLRPAAVERVLELLRIGCRGEAAMRWRSPSESSRRASCARTT